MEDSGENTLYHALPDQGLNVGLAFEAGLGHRLCHPSEVISNRDPTVKLYGRYLSPFVRRIGVTLHLLELPFEQIELSPFDDADALRRINPTGRVPALTLDDGTTLIESAAILDAIDHLVGPERALTPPSGPARQEVMQLCAYAVGACEKVVSGYYERARRPPEYTYEDWAQRCEAQARAAFAVLDERARGRTYLADGRLTQADVSSCVALAFAKTVLPEQVAPPGAYPALEALAERLDQLPAFQKTKA